MRVVGWNVNGLRACIRKGFLDVLKQSRADVVCLQEVRAFPEQLDAAARSPHGWHAAFSPAKRPGYSGVAIYSRIPPDKVETSLGEDRFDDEGRFMAVHFGRATIASVYFPKGDGKNRDNSRVPYKLDFYRLVFERIQVLRRRGPVLVLGDYNTAHQPIDLARPRDNKKNSGFLPEERAEFARWLESGWVDVFRKQRPGEEGHYTWWRQVGDVRARNVGWRIDYVLVSPAAAAKVEAAFIWPDIMGSDHCPVGVDIDIM